MRRYCTVDGLMKNLNADGLTMRHTALHLFAFTLLTLSLGCGDSGTVSPLDEQSAPNTDTGLSAEPDAMAEGDVDRSMSMDSGSTDEGVGVDDAMAALDDTATPGAEAGGQDDAGPEGEDSAGQGADPVEEPGEPTSPGEQRESEASGMSELPMGPADPTAAVACSLVNSPSVALTSATGLNEAGQILVDPSASTGYSVTLPASGDGYITLQVPDWMATIAAFVDHGTSLEILDPNFDTQEVLPVSWNGACSDVGMTDQRLLYHAWGSFAVRLIGEPNAAVHVSFIKVQ